MEERRKTRGRTLLAATIGLATVTLTGCSTTSGNLVAPPPDASEVDAGLDGGETDAGEDDASTDAGEDDAASEK